VVLAVCRQPHTRKQLHPVGVAALAVGVLAQAALEARGYVVLGDEPARQRDEGRGRCIAEARNFLAGWSESLEFWAALAGLDGDTVMRVAARVGRVAETEGKS